MIYKKGRYYMVKFHWKGKVVRKSTRATNAKTARSIEGRIRSELALGNFGILEEKKACPTLIDFLKQDFLPFTEGKFKDASKTATYYRQGSARLEHSHMASFPLDQITDQESTLFATRNSKLSPSTINQALRTLRRSLKLAEEWGMLKRAPKITLAKGERQRNRVLTDEEVRLYLMACAQPWRDVATIMYCLGNRPSELYSLRWEQVIFDAHGGSLNIVSGKSAKARRSLPMVPAVFRVLKARHDQQGNPSEGWAFPSESRSGHLEQGSAKNQHLRAIKTVNKTAADEAKKKGEDRSKEKLKAFPPYVLRHTALTNLSDKCDPFALQTIAGHSSITITQRYCHPQADVIANALSKMAARQEVVTDGGHPETSAAKGVSSENLVKLNKSVG